MRHILYSLLALLIFATPLQSQRLERFSEDHLEFMRQLEEYMTSSKRKALIEAYEEFEKVFNNGTYSEEEIQQILKTGNAMLAQRMVANPYFKNYLQALTKVKKTNSPTRHFQEWHAVLDQVLANIENRKLKPFDEFMKFSMQFFDKQALRYSSSGGTSWYALTDNFSFDFVEKEPVVTFDKLDLMASRRVDSIFIFETSGRFLPVNKIWKGEGGKVTWERHGLGPEVYAELEDYEFEMKSSLYEVRKAKMHYPTYFGSRIIAGTFSDKLVAQNDATDGSFPRFESDERLELTDIGEGIYYEGGFKLQGTTVYGLGSKENSAKINITDVNSQASFRGTSELFKIKKGELIAGQSVDGVLTFGQDSILHPSINVKFDIQNRIMTLSRGERASDQNPFYSSMHRVNFYSENITAYLNGDSIAIGREKIPMKRKEPVVFESLDYFKERDYQKLQNIATVNPIAALKILYDQEGTRFLPADVVAKKLNPRFTVENIKSLLFDMVARGFINYDNEEEEVEIKDKVLLYANAHLKKTDYDVLRIESETDTTNAVMNLTDNTIDISGVKIIEFSEKQKVAAQPQVNRFTMKRNRDIDLDGKIYAGFTTMEGKDFHFEYDPFHLQLDSIRFFDLFVPTGNVNEGNPEALSIGSRLEHLTGVLLIDAPSNKSGKDDIPMFPSLQSKDKSFVFYDYKGTQNGAYTRDSFFFQLYPFSFNHLDFYTREDVQFEGTLFSADIFPPFDELGTLQEDESIGFITETEGDGYPAYREKGQYKGEISLSNKGLLANGNVTYLGASIDSEDIIFMPKQMLASAERFDLDENRTEGEEVPKVEGLDVKIDWQPYQDSMYIRSEEAAFALFQEGQHTLDGTLILTPGGLKGVGVFDWETATMTSELFSFGAYSSFADTTNVKIKTHDLEDVALSTENVVSDVDFDEQLATFKANDEYLETKLPAIQYKTSMNEFTWDMAAENITFKSDPNKPGKFVSLHPDKDSLFFEGGDAFYDLKSDELQVSGVPYIVAADAFIYPDSGYIQIERGGNMSTLENAQIIADTINKYHVINRATVNVIGRRDYKASGFYEYNIGDKEQEIEFENIVGQPMGKGKMSERIPLTTGTGEVLPEDEFYIDHKTEFQGTISLSAGSNNLSFDGFARLDADRLPQKFWFTIKSTADKNNLAINYDEPKTYEGDPTGNGFFLNKETAEVYPRIMAPLFTRKDRAILPTKGVFTYTKEKDIFEFGDSLRVIANNMRGNKMTFYNGDGRVVGSGKLNIGSGLKYVSVEAAGVIRTTFPEAREEKMENLIVSDTASLVQQTGPQEEPEYKYQVEGDMMTGIKLIVPDKLMKIMLSDIKEYSFDASNVIYLTELDFYRPALINLFPPGKETDEALSTLGAGILDVPDRINPYTFLFSKIPVKWNPEYQSFVSQETKLGLISIDGEPLNKKLESYVEFKMPSNEDDRMYIYIKSPSELFYYFGFKQGILSVTSNNTAFMDELGAMKSKDLIMKMDDGNTYEIQPVDVGTARLFLNRAKAAQK